MGHYNTKDIAELIKDCYNREKRTPFTFITGAGCSLSAGIPLAVISTDNKPSLLEMIKLQYPFKIKRLAEADQGDYMKCMGCLTLSERRELLRPLVKDAKINWAHIALACLMKAGYVQRVLTFNFDNVLARACGLLGMYPATYDFTSADVNLHSLISNPAIVHLHGQSQGFVQLNDESQVNPQAERLGNFMRDTFLASPTLFIGYSGEADSFFDVIREKFEGHQDLFWLDHGADAKAHVQGLLNKHPHLSHHLGGQDADKFLIQLAQALGCFPPDVLRNPYTHLLDELKDVIDYPADLGGTDVLKDVRTQLTTDGERRANEKVSQSFLLLQGKYDEVIAAYNKVISPTDADKDDAAWAYIMQANGLAEDGDYKEAFKKYAEAVRIKPDKHEAWYNWGNDLGAFAANLSEPGCSQSYTEAFTKYAEAVRIKPDMHEAWYNWGNGLGTFAANLSEPECSQRYTEAFTKYVEAVRIKPDMHEAWYNWGSHLGTFAANLSEPERSQHYTEAFKKYVEATRIKPDKHEAWNNWGNDLGTFAASLSEPERSQRYTEAFTKYAEAVGIKPDMHDAWNNWGNGLAIFAASLSEPERSQRYTEAFTKYAEAVRIKPDMHDAWNNWGNDLGTFAASLTEPERSACYAEAERVLLQAELLHSDNVYNLACVYAMTQRLDEARVKLLHCKDKGTLPDAEHLANDHDLDPVRDLPWFADLLKP